MKITEPQSILIVEDEMNLGMTLYEYLKTIGHEVYLATTVQEATKLFDQQNPSIVLMDIGLPDGSGLELAKSLRQKRKNFVLLFLSAQNDPTTRLNGLEIGAEDYITKPFELKELTLRLKRVMQFQEKIHEVPEVVKHGNLEIYFKNFELVDANGAKIAINQKECAILKLLYQNKGKAISRDEIIDEVWGSDQHPSHRTVDNYIVTLRKWSETEEANCIEIKSIRGVGYKLLVNE